MTKRFTDTAKWNKIWFRKLSPLHKCFWEYIRDTCDHAGIWEIDFETAEYFIGQELNIEEIKNIFEKQFVEIKDGKKWFVPDFIEFQYGTLNPENRVHKSVIDILNKEGAYKGLKRPIQGRKDKAKAKVKDNGSLSRLQSLWNNNCTRLSKVIENSQTRKDKERPRIQERTVEVWNTVFSMINNSDFCCGKNDKNWKATYDWIMTNELNAIKVLEHKYDDHKPPEHNRTLKKVVSRTPSTPESKALLDKMNKLVRDKPEGWQSKLKALQKEADDMKKNINLKSLGDVLREGAKK